MGFFKRSQVKEEPARPVPESKHNDVSAAMKHVAVNDPASKPPPSKRQWKKTMKEVRKMDIKTYESKKLDRSIRMDSLLAQSYYHRQGKRPSLTSQSAYTPSSSPSISPLKEAAKVGWGTVSIGATKSFFRSPKK